MNYIEAVKELVNNPKAVAITFPTSKGITRTIQLKHKHFRGESYTYLVFPPQADRKEQTVIAHSPDFLLRNDFSVQYIQKKEYTAAELGSKVHEAIEMGIKIGKEEARRDYNAIAAKKLREAYEALIGEKL